MLSRARAVVWTFRPTAASNSCGAEQQTHKTHKTHDKTHNEETSRPSSYAPCRFPGPPTTADAGTNNVSGVSESADVPSRGRARPLRPLLIHHPSGRHQRLGHGPAVLQQPLVQMSARLPPGCAARAVLPLQHAQRCSPGKPARSHRVQRMQHHTDVRIRGVERQVRRVRGERVHLRPSPKVGPLRGGLRRF